MKAKWILGVIALCVVALACGTGQQGTGSGEDESFKKYGQEFKDKIAEAKSTFRCTEGRSRRVLHDACAQTGER